MSTKEQKREEEAAALIEELKINEFKMYEEHIDDSMYDDLLRNSTLYEIYKTEGIEGVRNHIKMLKYEPPIWKDEFWKYIELFGAGKDPKNYWIKKIENHDVYDYTMNILCSKIGPIEHIKIIKNLGYFCWNGIFWQKTTKDELLNILQSKIDYCLEYTREKLNEYKFMQEEFTNAQEKIVDKLRLFECEIEDNKKMKKLFSNFLNNKIKKTELQQWNRYIKHLISFQNGIIYLVGINEDVIFSEKGIMNDRLIGCIKKEYNVNVKPNWAVIKCFELLSGGSSEICKFILGWRSRLLLNSQVSRQFMINYDITKSGKSLLMNTEIRAFPGRYV